MLPMTGCLNECLTTARPRPRLPPQFRNLGVPLPWSLMEDARADDARFSESPEEARYWRALEALGTADPLPADLMQRFYFTPAGILRCGRYADRVAPFLAAFPCQHMMFIDLEELKARPEAVVRQVLQFVGANPDAAPFKEQPAGMAGEKRGRRIHPSVRRRLQRYYQDSNQRLYALLGRDFHWCDPEAGSADSGGSSFDAASTVLSTASSNPRASSSSGSSSRGGESEEEGDGQELAIVAVDSGVASAVKKGGTFGPLTDSLELAATPGSAFRIQAAGS